MVKRFLFKFFDIILVSPFIVSDFLTYKLIFFKEHQEPMR